MEGGQPGRGEGGPRAASGDTQGAIQNGLGWGGQLPAGPAGNLSWKGSPGSQLPALGALAAGALREGSRLAQRAALQRAFAASP